MTRVRRLQLRKLLPLALLIACFGILALERFRNMWAESYIAKMMEKKKTVCVGRYLVDVPIGAESRVSGGMLAGFEISVVEESKPAFDKRVAGRKAEIESRAAEAGINGPGGLVETRDVRVPGVVGEVLLYGGTRIHGIEDGIRVDRLLFSVDGYAYVGGFSFLLRKEIADEADTKLAESLIVHLRRRDENEIPAIPGFCVPRGVFVEPLPNHINEHMVMHLGIPDHPDLAMMLMMIAGGGQGKGLLARVNEVDANASFVERIRVLKLRARERNINGLAGEELVERVWENNFTTGYAFNWETVGMTDDVLRPYISLEMQTGVSPYNGGTPVDTSFRKNALFMLWDGIASSIRLSNVNVAQPSESNSAEGEAAVAHMAASQSLMAQSLPGQHSMVKKAQNRP